MIRQHKIPTLIGLLVLLIGLGVGIYLVSRQSNLVSFGKPEEAPREVRITNTSDTSFSVSWITDTPTTGFIAYGKSASLGQTQPDVGEAKITHHTTITNLEVQTTYYFKVASNSNLYDNNKEPYQTKTAPTLPSVPAPNVISGSVNASAGVPSNGAIIYVTIPGAVIQSTITDTQGKWSIPLSTARATNLSSFATYTKSAIIDIYVQAGGGKFASAKIQAGAAHPVPPIILGKSNDFSSIKPLPEGGVPDAQIDLPDKTLTVQGAATPTPTPTVISTPSPAPLSSKKTVTLDNPESNESVNTIKPEFMGTGSPGLVFNIKVESVIPVTDKVTVDKNGKWSWSPPSNLATGDHTITIDWIDEKGKKQTTIRSFTILAQGKSSVPAFSASGSAQLATPSPTPKVTATPKPSTTPTASASARVAHPATSSGVPTSGNLTATLSLIIMGIVLVLAGLFLPKTRMFKEN